MNDNIQPAEPLKFVFDEVNAAALRRNLITLRGVRAAKDRKADFATDLEMKLTGVGIDPETRAYADELLDDYWKSHRYRTLRRIKGSDQRTKREVIIGSGFHAATYAATRVACGFPRPIVIDQAERAGGVFAMTRRPMFYLNSSNRPGGPGFTSDLEAQPNFLPGAPVQPANLSAAEFETNADMAWIIRMTLAQNAEVVTNFEIRNYSNARIFFGDEDVPRLIGPDGEEIMAGRVIDARGIGSPRDLATANGKSILSFSDFMKRMDQPWPLRGIRRVAVIGDGDAGRVSVEQLIGIGPQMNLSMALDRVDLIDWYGRNLPATPRDWRDTERTRYLPIAKFLKDGNIGTRQVRVFNRRANPIAIGDQAIVEGRTYDLVVLATGWTPWLQPNSLYAARDLDAYFINNLQVGRFYGRRIIKIGPHAEIDFNRTEQVDRLDQESNKISMSRLGPKTAALAANLPEPEMVGYRGTRVAA